MGVFFGKPKIEGDERQRCLSYYEAELKLKAFQEKEADLYNKAAVKYARSTPTDSDAAKEMCRAANRLSQSANEILKRRDGMPPIPDAASAMYFAWQLTYSDYAAWASAQLAAVEAVANGMQPHTERVRQLLEQSEKSRQRAEKDERKFLERLKLSASEIRKMFLNASAAVSAENWQPEEVRDDFIQIALDLYLVALELYLENVSKLAEHQFEYSAWSAWGLGANALFEGLKNIPEFKMMPDSLDKGKLLLELGIQTMISLWYHNWESQEKESHSDEEWEMARKISLRNVQTFLGISSEDSIKLYLGFDKELQCVLNRECTFPFCYMDMFYQRFRECITGDQIVDWGRLQFPIELDDVRMREFVDACYEDKYRSLGSEESMEAFAAVMSAGALVSDAFRSMYKKERSP